MASIESLIPLIYHEKQQPGSMLCAQHALNSLLQGNYFTAPDLSHIAGMLDTLEEHYDTDNRGQTSMNMDDTGFFSVQVLENALQVWGLSLVRWRSEAMRPYQQHPHTQLAFILNYQQHWYTLRRFGRASPDASLEADPGEGHWFNLNSSLPAPERVGKLHLGMVLQQAEAEGYSVFAVIQTDPEAPLALPRTEVDELAASISEPSSFTNADPSRATASTSEKDSEKYNGFEDEDMELQAALQASLMRESESASDFPPHLPPPPALSSSMPGSFSTGTRTPTQHIRRGYGVLQHEDPPILVDDEEENEYHPLPSAIPAQRPTELDPLEASRARSRAYMEHVMRQQEEALRAQYEEEAAQVAAGRAPRRRQPLRDEEDEELMRAIEESRRDHPSPDADINPEEAEPSIEPQRIPAASTWESHRVYDDDDAELQAALKASLESVPEGFRIPSTPPRPAPPPLSTSAATSTNGIVTQSQQQEDEDIDVESEAGSSVAEEAAAVSVEEMRQRRLAKFGG